MPLAVARGRGGRMPPGSPSLIAGRQAGPRVAGKNDPEPTLADHGATMAMLRKRAGNDEAALREIREWGQRRERRLPVLREFARLLHGAGIIGENMDRADRDYAIAQCYAIATGHGLDMMDYEYRDWESGPLASLMSIDLHAIEPDGDGAAGDIFPDAASERAFLEEVRGVDLDGLGRMARDAVIPGRERVALE